MFVYIHTYVSTKECILNTSKQYFAFMNMCTWIKMYYVGFNIFQGNKYVEKLESLRIILKNLLRILYFD